ncbi:hypothetical protein NGB36_24430 [Streptomyces sp. RB6PN25]|uniref:Uncharacterized protein n=1 Tax=Streptomyces humicola TaxID=2953240 RepID=A0ABT1Q164_9ACTN|nr:hypothetical protein [Streptomyces humicola]MCQ4083659.1 hypothetical protein [Streptomyces humicola]
MSQEGGLPRLAACRWAEPTRGGTIGPAPPGQGVLRSRSDAPTRIPPGGPGAFGDADAVGGAMTSLAATGLIMDG